MSESMLKRDPLSWVQLRVRSNFSSPSFLFSEYMPYIYAAPWIRCQVYIMGILVGYFMQKRPKLRINKVKFFYWCAQSYKNRAVHSLLLPKYRVSQPVVQICFACIFLTNASFLTVLDSFCS